MRNGGAYGDFGPRGVADAFSKGDQEGRVGVTTYDRWRGCVW
jgi:hypothetical protein